MQKGAEFEFPGCVLPCLLPHFAKDLSTLLTACCVSQEWRFAISSDPHLWQNIRIPDKLREKLTNENLSNLLDRLNGSGLISIDVSECSLLDDLALKRITASLKEAPELIDFTDCHKITWRSVIPFARQLLEVLRAKKEKAKGPPAEWPHYVVNLAGVQWRGCPRLLFVECFVNTPLEDDLDDARICRMCNRVEGTEDCSFCPGTLVTHNDCLKTAKCCCVCSRRACEGCEEHFELDIVPAGGAHPCGHYWCLECEYSLPLTCEICNEQVCPLCSPRLHTECVNCLKTVCFLCRLDTSCSCKYDGIIPKTIHRLDIPTTCDSETCLVAVQELRCALYATDGSKRIRIAETAAIGTCSTCNRLRTYGDAKMYESLGHNSVGGSGGTLDWMAPSSLDLWLGGLNMGET